MILAVGFAFSLALSSQHGLERYIYPLAPQRPCPPVAVDVTDFPQGKEWGAAARSLVEGWYPLIVSLLSTQEFKQPSKITLTIKKEISAPAYASGDEITINGKWITDHPGDLGMVIHELTHVIQRYPGSKFESGWLVEGIADYVRWWRYEPEAKRQHITDKNKITDGYGVTASFLAWASKKYDSRLVPMLDSALRKAADPMPVFRSVTGKSADDLWKEFLAAVAG